MLARLRRTLPYTGQAEDLYLYVLKDIYPRLLGAHLAAFMEVYLEREGAPDREHP